MTPLIEVYFCPAPFFVRRPRFAGNIQGDRVPSSWRFKKQRRLKSALESANLYLQVLLSLQQPTFQTFTNNSMFVSCMVRMLFVSSELLKRRSWK